jgi:outer membrane protein assembly factor BamB
MLRLSCSLVLVVSILACGQTSLVAQAPVGKPLPAGEWPQFLGPNRNGISAETGHLDAWPASGPKEIWRVNGGVGMSGLAISRGRLVTLVQREGQQWVVSHAAGTGEAQWQTAVASEYRNPMGDGPRGTPAIAGESVFAFTGEGILVALGLADGKLLWSHNVVEELRGKIADYGMASSPLVVNGQVIVTAGAPRATVAAYDAKTGKLAWSAGEDAAGYSSPVVRELAGGPQILVFSGGAALGIAPQTGGLLWRHPYETNFQCNIAAPVARDGQVLLSAGENHGSVLLAPKQAGGKWTLEEVWSSQGVQSVLRSEWQTPILLDGYLYGMDNVGGAGPITHLTCIEWSSGKRMWQVPRFGKGNLIAAEGKLFLSTMKGELVVARATPKAYEEIGRAEVLGSTRQAPSLAGGMLYLRDDQDIVCLDVRRP